VEQGAEHRGSDLLALGISPVTQDLACLEEIFNRIGFRFQAARSYREALRVLCAHRMPIIICNDWLPDGNWKDILSLLAPLSEPYQLIVMTGTADERLAAEVRAMSAFDVLPKPLRAEEIVSLVGRVWRSWREADRVAPLPEAAIAAA